MHLIKDSQKATKWINEFFDNDPTTDFFSLKFTRKNPSSKDFDPDKFLANLRKYTGRDDFTGRDEFNEFFDIDESPLDLGPFSEYDPLHDEFDEWIEDNQPTIDKNIPIPGDDYYEDFDFDEVDPDGEWLRNKLQTEHRKNKSKRKRKEIPAHPMERLKNAKDDEVGIFPIGYVKYLESQNDLLRKNNIKGGKDVKEKRTK